MDNDYDLPLVPAKLMKRLFKEALNVLKLSPWRNIPDICPFVLVDPETHEKQIVCVMGNAGELFGVQVYLPTEGTRAYTQLAGQFGSEGEAEMD